MLTCFSNLVGLIRGEGGGGFSAGNFDKHSIEKQHYLLCNVLYSHTTLSRHKHVRLSTYREPPPCYCPITVFLKGKALILYSITQLRHVSKGC